MRVKEYADNPVHRPATERQLEYLRAIHGEMEKNHGRPPTFRELGTILGVSSTNGIAEAVGWLIRKRLIGTDMTKSRSMWLTEAGLRSIGVVSEKPSERLESLQPDGLSATILDIEQRVATSPGDFCQQTHDILGWLKELEKRRGEAT